MKKIFFLGVFLLCFLPTLPVLADALADYQQAQKEYLSAWVSLGAYNDRIGHLARMELADAGWEVQGFNEEYDGAEAKFFIVKNESFLPQTEIYLLAITGTESKRDIATDLTVDKVLFGGTTPAEFAATAQKRDLQASDPMVHGGFYKYTQAAFFSKIYERQTLGEHMAQLLKENRQRKLYLTGHSLGGAAATLAAARLIAMGVLPEQLEVISFGAPPIGNQAFADAYGKHVQLERIVLAGDPVAGVLQAVRPDYAQFGNKKVWEKKQYSEQVKHAMVLYLDAALHNYYDARQEAEAAGVLAEMEAGRAVCGQAVYVAPFVVHAPADLADDILYMKLALRDLCERRLFGCSFGAGERMDFRQELARAKAAGCKYVLFDEFTATSLREVKHGFYIAMQEEIYDVEGRLQGSVLTATNTEGITPLEAVIYNWLVLKADREKILLAH